MTRIFLLLFFSLITFYSTSQNFVEVPNFTAKVNYTVIDDNYGVALVGGFKNYLSTNQGVTWLEFDNSAGSPLENFEGLDAAIVSSTVYCIIGRNSSNNTYSVARTDDGGSTWAILNTVSGGATQEFRAIQSNGNNLVIAAKNGVYYSTDGGATWINNSLSSGGEISNFVDYNVGSDTWFIGSYDNDILISSDQGVTWTPLGTSIVSSQIVNSSNNNNQILLTHDLGSYNQLLTIDASNNIIDIIEIPQGLLMSWPSLNAAEYLPSGDIVACNNDMFYLIDTASWNVYHINYPSTSGNAGTRIAMGATYGIASKWWSPGSVQTVYLVDYAVAPITYVPAKFYIVNEQFTCAGDDIVALPYATYGDSVQWFVNNVYVGSDTLLTYPTPPVPSVYTIKLNVYYNGIMKTTTQTITFYPPQSPHTFVYQTDTIACYDQPHLVFINPDSGSPQNTAVKVLYGGQLVAGPQTMTSSNMYLYTSPLTTQDTLLIISYNTSPCDSSADTITIPMTLGPNMLDFNYLPYDSSICIGESALLELENTNSQYTYDFSTTFSSVGPPWNNQLSGVGPDTLTITPPGLPISVNNDLSAGTYYPYTYMFLTTEVTDINTGCLSPQITDTFRIYRSKAYYELHSRSFLQNDTVHLSNAFVTDNRLWSSESLSSNYISNSIDIIPLIVADTVGFFDIQLRNEPLPGCVDSTVHHVHYANTADSIQSACDNVVSGKSENLHRTRIDPFGNIYEISAQRLTLDNVPVYIFRKYDAQGALLWERKGAYNGWTWGEIKGIVIEDMDFDCDGNPVCAMWIQGYDDYVDSYFEFLPGSGNTQRTWCYVTKIDKTSGDIIWRSRLNDMPLANIGSSTGGWRITDLVVNQDRIYVSTYKQWGLEFITLDSDGNYINSTPLELGGWSQTPFIPEGKLCPYGGLGGGQQSYWSPQLGVLSTGEVIAIGNYNDVFLPNYPELDIVGSPSGIFAMKYDTDNGVYDVSLIANTGDANFYSGTAFAYDNYMEIPRFTIDKYDNITVAAYWQYGPAVTQIMVLDSVIPMSTGTFVFNMDADYNMNWLALGTHSIVQDLVQIESTGDIYLASRSNNNLSFGNGMTNIMIGEDVQQTITYNSLPNYTDYPWLSFPTKDGFLTKFDSSGTPLAMKKISDLSANPSFVSKNRMRLSGSPCGKLILHSNNANSSPVSYELDGQLFILDSSIMHFYYANCAQSTCSYVNAPDSIEICSFNSMVNLNLCNYYNLDSITFDLYQGANLISANQTAIVTNGNFDLSLPSNGSFLLAIETPNSDTLVITNNSILPPTYSLDDTICFGTLLYITASEPSYQYDWLNGTMSGAAIVLDQSNYTLGQNSIDVTIDNGVCSYTDTLHIFIDGCLSTTSPFGYTYSIYPNPNDGAFSVSIDVAYPETFAELFDLNGRSVEKHFFDGETTIKFESNLSSGTYLLEIRHNGLISTERIVIR